MRRRRRARDGQEKRKRENSRPILKKLCAALLRSFRGQHSEKMNRSAQGNWDPREGQQPFRPNPNGVGDRTTTWRRLLIGAVFTPIVMKHCEKSSFLLYCKTSHNALLAIFCSSNDNFFKVSSQVRYGFTLN